MNFSRLLVPLPPALAIAFGLAILALGGCDNSGSVSASSPLQYGTKVDFGSSGNAGPIKTSGWSPAEEKFTWSEGDSAVLTVPVPATDRPVTLSMRMSGLFKTPELPAQPVEVIVNGTKIADWQVSEIENFSAPVPESATKAGTPLNITFKIPQASTPKALGKGDDPRKLGICVYELVLTTS